jgi:hypothetical protein
MEAERMALVEEIAEKLRREPYNLLTNDCLIKSRKLKRACRAHSIPVKVVACIGLARARVFGRWLTLPVVHGWGEVEGKRIEVSRPRGVSGTWGIVPAEIRPVLAVSF